MIKFDPGPCPVDDAPHTTCTAPGPIVIVQLPARDGVAPSAVRVPIAPPAGWGALPIPSADPPSDTAFTTTTYDRKKHRPK